MVSKGNQCKGVLGGKTPCKRSRDGSGKPIVMNTPCSKCKEQRCKQHCHCGRNGIAKGRQAPRSPKVKPEVKCQAQPAVPQVQTSQVQLCLGRPPHLAVSVFTDSSWCQQVVEEIGSASVVTLASYMYDHPAVHSALVRRLTGKEAFACEILVDKEQYDRKTAPHQAPKLRELKSLDAVVYLCSGTRGQGVFGKQAYLGSMHMKILLLDNKIAYYGSANFTHSAVKNWELVTRMVGPPVKNIVSTIQSLKMHKHTKQL
jgi:hypothetical protein